MSQLVELHSRKAARILESARGLVLDHGAGKVTVSEISRAAGVGKGTVYLYWPSKEDLIRGLFARDLLALLEEGIARISADAGMVRPRRLAPLVVRTGLRLPLGRRLYSGDPELLRLLMQDAGDRELYARTRPAAMCNAVMPILRRHGLIRDDRPLPSQAYALHALLDGFSTAVYHPETAPAGVDDPDAVLADTVALLLEPAQAPGEAAVEAAAEETLAIFREIRDAVLDLIDRSQTAAP
ncbi:AcrR family transcriptional regulator [Nonomuraea thailandensis]|uniref:AcrR family transcriptional regulator n=1 Tax=Nonomuraea thailandensis TaxID=1188745 RepID=A0A9X2GDS3_9ACTN|nr:TetR/AcrR family transcriptional regulator [Nonomuraea thailandensis]MCP2355549.1 AcrR family transcriptional regulator [Nonomuraea thailandensis]